jgi:hypothetical protein
MKGWLCLDTGRMFLKAVIHGNGSAGTTNVVVQRCFDEDMPHFGKGMILYESEDLVIFTIHYSLD